MDEIWKPIVIKKNNVLYDYTNLYEISNKGNVRNLNYRGTGKIRMFKLHKNNHGYLTVILTKDGERQEFKVHRLVATAFIPNPNNYEVVNHINEIKTDCRVENLEWCTREYNTSYSQKGRPKKGKLKCRKCRIICVETKQIFNSVDEVVVELKRNFTEDMKSGTQSINASAIYACCNQEKNILYNYKLYNFRYLED